MNSISIFGTSSDSGKSTLTFVIAKILQENGINAVPFKAQNVSNNSTVADDGSEIAIAQYFQAKVLGLKTSHHLNPILLKTGKNHSSTLIVNGKSHGDIKVKEYYAKIDELKPYIDASFEHLKTSYDVIVAEGAGSPVELNLMQKDLSNIYTASKFDTKIILVADIEKGGVFASIYGTYNLLPKELQKNVIGVIANKFRGDMSLFDEGIRIIENDFKIPVLGVLPYIALNFGFEDSLSIVNLKQNIKNAKIKVGVIKYPYMSNFNDFEPLLADTELNVSFIEQNIDLTHFDLLILPGSKLVVKDLQWLKQNGLFAQIKNYKKQIFGVCGGYEMMFENIIDTHNIESGENEIGFGFIDDDIVFEKQKVLNRKNYNIFNLDIHGFEIHHGVSKKGLLFYEKENIKGTFVHGVFDNDNFRAQIFKAIDSGYIGFNFEELKKNSIDSFINEIKKYINIDLVLKSVR